MKRIIRIFVYLFEFVKYYALFPLALLKYRGRKIYLIAERGTDARDNGYHLFSYICRNHPEIEVYYAITKNSPDRPKVEQLGKVVDTGSLEHYLLFIAADYKISTHIAGYSPFMFFYSRFVNWLIWRGKRIFIQHGVIPNDLKALYYENTKVDIFVCGAKPEYDDVVERYHYNGQVKYTGLARYDALHNIQLKHQILVMPTWRLFLSGLSAAEVRSSEYVRHWQELLQDARLLHAAQKHNVNIVFYPHYEMQKFLEVFKAVSPWVTIADFAHFDVQQLLKESKLLVTDYSSVFFDFGYMRKPCIYYQFDADRFFSEHYRKGYFDYETMGFGPLISNHDVLVEHLVQYIENNFKLEDTYRQRQVDFFPLHDRENCKRIFQEIQKL